jgi:hypothetical protein
LFFSILIFCSTAPRLTTANSACVPRTPGPSPADAAASVTGRGSDSEVSISPARSTDGPPKGDEAAMDEAAIAVLSSPLAAMVTAQPHRTRGRRRGLESRQGEGEPKKMLKPMATWMSVSNVTCKRGGGGEGGDVAHGRISESNSNSNRYASNSRPLLRVYQVSFPCILGLF